MISKFPSNINSSYSAQEEPYNSLFDKLLIFVGKNTIRFLPYIIGLGAIAILSISILLGSLIMVHEVGERFNEIEVRQHEKQVFAEQQTEQIEKLQNSQTEQKAVKKIDESGWFVILDEGEDLQAPAANFEPMSEEEADWADGSQQFMVPKAEAPTAGSDIIEDSEEFAISN